MSLLREALWLNCLADFMELPPDLRTLVLQHIGKLVIHCPRDVLGRVELDRVWDELDLDVTKPVGYVVE